MLLFKEAGKIKNSDPASDDAQNLVKRIQDYITENLYTCTNKILQRTRKNVFRWQEILQRILMFMVEKVQQILYQMQ